jgi:hypothetical protein
MPREETARRGRKKRKKCRKLNPGWFKRGFDPRRSRYRFTAQDCRLGWWVANILHPELRDWLRMRLYIYYWEKRNHGPQEKPGGRTARESVPAGADAGGDDGGF